MVTYEDTQKAKIDPIYMDKLIKENEKIVWYVYHRFCGGNDAEEEDLIQIGKIGLFRAIMSFKDVDIQFMTYANKIVCSYMLMEFRRRKRKKCSGLAIQSLQEPIAEDDMYLEDVLEDTSESIEEQVISKIQIDEFASTLTGRNLEIFKMRMEDKTQREISDKVGIARSVVSRKIQRLGNKLERKYGLKKPVQKPTRIKTGCDKVKVGNTEIDKIAKAIAEWMVSNPNRTPNLARIVKDAGLVWGEGFKDSEYMKPAITKLKSWGYQVEEVDFNLWVVVPTVKVYYDMSYKNTPKEEKKEEIVHIPEPVKEEIKPILKKDVGEAKENTVIVKEMVEKIMKDIMEFRYSKTNTDVEALKNLIDLLNGMVDMDENAKLDISVVVKVA